MTKADRNRRYREALRQKKASQASHPPVSGVSPPPSFDASHGVFSDNVVPVSGGASQASHVGGAGGGLNFSDSEKKETLNTSLLSSALNLNAREASRVTETVTTNATVELTQARQLEQAMRPRPVTFYLQGDEGIPDELLAGCRMDGFQEHVVLEEWVKYVANQSGKGQPVTTAGLGSAFRRGWLPKTRRVKTKAQAVLAEDDLAAIEAQKIRERESKLLEQRMAQAKKQQGPPDAETAAKMTDMLRRLEQEAPTPKAPLKFVQEPDTWVPDPKRIAEVAALLEAEIAKAGGRQ